MTDDALETIWAERPDIFDGMGFWNAQEWPGGIEYIRADLATAQIEAAVKAEREACAARLDAIAAIYAADATGLRAEGSEDGGGYDRDAEVIRIAAAAIRARGEG